MRPPPRTPSSSPRPRSSRGGPVHGAPRLRRLWQGVVRFVRPWLAGAPLLVACGRGDAVVREGERARLDSLGQEADKLFAAAERTDAVLDSMRRAMDARLRAAVDSVAPPPPPPPPPGPADGAPRASLPAPRPASLPARPAHPEDTVRGQLARRDDGTLLVRTAEGEVELGGVALPRVAPLVGTVVTLRGVATSVRSFVVTGVVSPSPARAP